jgi:RNA polymerase sigma-70 factor (ECF subfamily)
MDTTNDDRALLECAARGDESALRTLLKRFGPDARRRIQGKIGSKYQALIDEDDVMQVTYLEAFLHAETLRARDATAFIAWLARIAENALRDAIRGLKRQKRPDRAKRVQAAAGADSGVVLLEQLGWTTTTPSRQVAREDARRCLEAAMSRLPDDYAAVVRLVDLEGHATGDAASRLQRSVGAVCMLRARAHDRLRRELGRASQFFSDSA